MAKLVAVYERNSVNDLYLLECSMCSWNADFLRAPHESRVFRETEENAHTCARAHVVTAHRGAARFIPGVTR